MRAHLRQRAPWLALGIIVAGAALRLAAPERHSLWLDEATSLQFARHATEGTLRAEVNNPPLFRLLLHAWIRAVDQPSDTWLRLPSILFGIASLLFVWFLARRLLPPLPALVALGLFALDPMHLLFSQEARAYSLLTLCAVATWYLHLTTIGTYRCWASRIALGATIAVGLHAHYFYAWVLLPVVVHRVWIAWRRPADERASILALALPVVIGALTIGPWAYYFVTHVGAQDRDYTKNLPGQIAALPYLLLLGNSAVVRSYPESYPAAALRQWYLIVPFALAFAPAVYYGVRRLWRAVDPPSGGRFLLAALAVPLVGCVALFPVLPLFTSRYLSFLAPAACLLTAAGVTAIPRPALARGALALIVALQLLSLGRYHFDPSYGRENWRGAAAWVAARERPGAAIVFDKFYVHIPFDRYHRKPTRRYQLPKDPRAREAVWQRLRRAGHREIFLVQSHVWDIGDRAARRLRTWLCQREHHIFRQSHGIEVYRFEPCSAAAGR